MMATRSDIVIASVWSCVTATVVTPTSDWIRLSSICIVSRSCLSSAAIGSSSNSTLGRIASARATATRCCWPPDSERTLRAAMPGRRTSSSISSTTLRRSALGTLRRPRPNATLSATVMCGNSA